MILRRFFTALTLLMSLHAVATNFTVTDYGAVGDGKTDNTAAIQAVLDRCSESGGGSVIFPAGIYISAPLSLRSNVNMHMAPNSVLLANPDESLYKLSAFGANEGEGMMWLHGRDIENFSISGTGRIDGNGVAFMGAELDDSYELKPVTTFDPRPHVLTLINAKKVNISDVTISNSAYWTVHLVGCYDVTIKGISLLNNLKIRNGDGIDIDHSRKVRISDCFIESGDDCICLKNRREYEQYGSCEDIVVTNCIMTSRSCSVKIGSENMDRIANVLISNCIIRDSNRGIGIQNRDEGSVENVTFQNILLDCHLFSEVWWGQSEAIYVTSYPRAVGNHKDAGWRFPKGAKEGKCGPVKNIRFLDIYATSENGVYIGCDTPGKIADITLDNVNIDLVETSKYEKGVYDRRPANVEGFIKGKSYGVSAENVDGLTIRNFNVNASSFPTKFYGGVYDIINCQRVIK